MKNLLNKKHIKINGQIEFFNSVMYNINQQDRLKLNTTVWVADVDTKNMFKIEYYRLIFELISIKNIRRLKSDLKSRL